MVTFNDKLWASEYNSPRPIIPSRGGRLWTPNDLVKDRAFNLANFNKHDVFYDKELGYRIDLRSGAAPRSQNNFPLAINDEFVSLRNERSMPDNASGWEMHIASHRTMPTPWYALEMPGWTDFDGSGHTVAVLDSGIAPNLVQLPRAPDHADFIDCEMQSAIAYDSHPNGHGTNCAGVIGAIWPGQRYSVAPGCKILAAKVRRVNGRMYTTLVDILLMLSWSIAKGARIVSMSFCASTEGLAIKGPPDIFGSIAQRLRNADRALIFCAAMDDGASISYPANVDGTIAVGVYAPTGTIPPIGVAYIVNPPIWQHKQSRGELLFAPGSLLETVDLAGNRDSTFGGSSGACAFAAGVAALYLHKYAGKLDLNGILAQMRADATRLPNPANATSDWYCVRFPV